MNAVLKKMTTQYTSEVITYYLETDQHWLKMNQLIGRTIHINWTHNECQSCHEDKPIFGQGLCKRCYFESPMAGEWIMNPELSKAHLGIEDRDLTFEKEMQLQPHYVYLAASGGIKVGVTRCTQVPTRWIDQGADYAIPILQFPNRYLAGKAEVVLKKYIADKTNWRKMLSETASIDGLKNLLQMYKKYLPDDLQSYGIEAEILHLKYPIIDLPQKVTTINLNKSKECSHRLTGIKGQYLIFDNQSVINIRSHEGFGIELNLL